ncbi:MAG: hypothetical protein RML94_04375 [Bacteroidia bacterium]|nr:hypothetical protein [Bacteroidia bacterium]
MRWFLAVLLCYTYSNLAQTPGKKVFNLSMRRVFAVEIGVERPVKPNSITGMYKVYTPEG